MNTLYLWDQAWTLIDMTWDVAASGYADYDAFARAASDGLSDRDPFVFEQLYELTFTEHWHRTVPLPGALVAVQQPGDHWTFSTGLPEQWDWILGSLASATDCEILARSLGAARSTFEFASTNVKTAPMYRSLLAEAVAAGYDHVVVVDDKPQYLEAAGMVTHQFPSLTVELIHVATHPGRFPTPSGIRRVETLANLAALP